MGLRAAFMVMALVWVASANAASQVTVNISGIVLATPPCVINSGKRIDTYFGDVQTKVIDGRYKTITIPYSLDCSRAVKNEVRMQIQGSSGFTSSLLAVPGNSNLGIQLIKDGSKFAINTWENFNRNSKPQLQAVLVKKAPDSQITTGAFSVSAVLMVEYQ